MKAGQLTKTVALSIQQKGHNMSNTAVPTGIFLLAIAIGVSGLACRDETPPPSTFKEGDLVRHKLDNREGVVIAVYVWMNSGATHSYLVRFSANQATTDTHVLDKDGPIQTSVYSDVRCKEFELSRKEP